MKEVVLGAAYSHLRLKENDNIVVLLDSGTMLKGKFRRMHSGNMGISMLAFFKMNDKTVEVSMDIGVEHITAIGRIHYDEGIQTVSDSMIEADLKTGEKI